MRDNKNVKITQKNYYFQNKQDSNYDGNEIFLIYLILQNKFVVHTIEKIKSVSQIN